MSGLGRLVQPWAHRAGTFAVPGSLLVRLKLGEIPDGLPCALDVRCGAARPAESTQHNVIDRVVKSFGGVVMVSRLHAAAQALRSVSKRHRGYSAAEELSGISRVLKFDFEPDTHVGSLAVSLMQLDIVESAMPNYVASVGLDGINFVRGGAEGDPDGWNARDMVNARRALAYCAGDSAVVIAVVDSGINPRHPEFRTGDSEQAFGDRLRRGFDTVDLTSSQMATGVEMLGDNRGADTDPTDRFVGQPPRPAAAAPAGAGAAAPPAAPAPAGAGR